LALSGRLPEASSILGRLHGSRDPQALFMLGTLLGSRGDLGAAAQCLIAYTLRRPEDPLGWANLARVYARLGQTERAAGARRRAIEACGRSDDYARLLKDLLAVTQ